MYVGLTALLVGWAVWLSVPWVLLGPVALMLFLTRFQIIPEERVMSSKIWTGLRRLPQASSPVAVA